MELGEQFSTIFSAPAVLLFFSWKDAHIRCWLHKHNCTPENNSRKQEHYSANFLIRLNGEAWCPAVQSAAGPDVKRSTYGGLLGHLDIVQPVQLCTSTSAGPNVCQILFLKYQSEFWPSARGLDSNYCLNPDNERKPWCYTRDSGTYREYYQVPTCRDSARPGNNSHSIFHIIEEVQMEQQKPLGSTLTYRWCCDSPGRGKLLWRRWNKYHNLRDSQWE